VSLIEEKITKVIMEQLNMPREECVPEADFIDDLGANYLDIVELGMALEENFDIVIGDDELERLRTIQDLVDHIVDVLIQREEGN
jgi:acyl carrier protein